MRLRGIAFFDFVIAKSEVFIRRPKRALHNVYTSKHT
jgi:hypothetical protein